MKKFSLKIFLISILAVCFALAGCTVGPSTPPGTYASAVIAGNFCEISLSEMTDEAVFADVMEKARAYAEGCTAQLDELNSSGKVENASPEFLALVRDAVSFSDAVSSPAVGSLVRLWFDGGESAPSGEALASVLDGVRNFSLTTDGGTVTADAILTLSPLLEARTARIMTERLSELGVRSACVKVGSVTGVVGNADIPLTVSGGESEKEIGYVTLTDSFVYAPSVYTRYYYEGDVLRSHIISAETGIPADGTMPGIAVFFTQDESVVYTAYSALCAASPEDAVRICQGCDGIVFLRDGDTLPFGGVGTVIPFASVKDAVG